jgi:ADP-ribosyl-[dinitrogen reductase] hydrolase
MKNHDCPVCKSNTPTNPRYPAAVCRSCVTRATDGAGRTVELFNAGFTGGFLAQYADGTAADDVTNSKTVYIDGSPYHADEGHMGGIVVTPAAAAA